MFLNFIRKSSLIFSLLAATGAYAQPQDVRCPSINSIQQATDKIDVALKLTPSFYGAYHSEGDFFTENKLSWNIWIMNITADSSDEALAKSKETTQKCNLQKQEYATKINHTLFKCAYGPGEIVAFGHPLTM